MTTVVLTTSHAEQTVTSANVSRIVVKMKLIHQVQGKRTLRNRSVELESMYHKLSPQPTAHSRSRNIMGLLDASHFVQQRARDVGTLLDVVNIMNESTKYASYMASGVTPHEKYLNLDTLSAN